MTNFTLSVAGRAPISGDLGINNGVKVITNRLCIVNKIEEIPVDDLTFGVNAVAYQDVDLPMSVGKGHTIPVLPSMASYLSKIQTEQAYNWVVRPYMLWINRTDWMAECIGAGWGNFLQIIGEVTTRAGTFYEIAAFYYNDKMQYNPAEMNWFNYPTLFGKCTAKRVTDHKIINVGAGLDCYFPNMKRNPHLWVYAGDVELFPEYPAGVKGYVLQGASVYGYTGSGNQLLPLRLARKPSELIEPTDWHLKTGSVIPPA